HHEQRLSPQLSIFEHAHASRSLSEKHSSIRSPNNRPHDFQIRNNSFHFECCLGISRDFDFTCAAARRRMAASKRYERNETGYERQQIYYFPFVIFHLLFHTVVESLDH